MIRAIFCGLFLVITAETWSQAPFIVNKLTVPINFDGVPDEAAWQSVQPLPMTMHSPVFGNEPTEASIIRIAYDDVNFYVSGILSYKNPGDIRAIGKKRDMFEPTTDWFGIILDTFNDKVNAVSFWTNPNGLRTDATVKNDFVDMNSDVNSSWNTFWDVKSIISGKGWSAEFRIPFSSLRFQEAEGKTLMGITVLRYSPAKSEMATFPAVPPSSNGSYWKPSLTTLIEFEGLKPRKPVYITPYITGGIGQVNELAEEGTDYDMTTTLKYDAGVDAKYSITNNLTVDLTVNTDFAQVEADDQKINLTRYS
ncbi:MAG: carbohydrate binding family 9 domain-containing protein, partial [Bacteroidales bacterium]|nr:carbohydrate binding family 9 domain-containing protein [Bacteroidales bacterium]